METGSGTVAAMPLGEFLTTEEPVWVWDASARRILWANDAGRHFWGSDSLDSLRERRFSSRNQMVRRLAALASQTDASKERIETMAVDAAFGRSSVKCHLQGLIVAGGKPGLIVKVLDQPQRHRQPEPNAELSPQRRPALRSDRRDNRSASDKAALEAIAMRLKKGPRKTVSREPANTVSAFPTDERLELGIRELCHEIRNPLSVISGFAERIKDIAPPGKQQLQLRAYADDIVESAALALAILRDFSANPLAQTEDRQEPEAVNLRSVIESCLRLVAPIAGNNGVRLYRRTAGNIPHLLASERVIKQVLLNLLMNALRHNKNGGQIKVTARLRKDGTVRLAVIDDGKGMTKKEIKAALSHSRTSLPPEPGRSGLGLPLVRRLVEELGGQFAIESARGAGTTIEIVLPAATA